MKENTRKDAIEPILSFQNFTFKYRAQVEPTLIDINLSIYPGEKILIVGPSGSGKSTLAHCINGLVPFSFKGEITGEYSIKGKRPDKLGIFELSKIVGTVLQDTDGQFVGLTVGEDVAFSLENDKIPQQQMMERVNEIAKIFEISSVLSNAPWELSGGQKQRVSMAGVMVDRVELLLFDEPLANLDPATGKRTIALIDEIQKKEGITTIIIEHRLEDALYRKVDRILVMSEGRIVADMTPNELLSSSILEECGIREPLYLTAMKYAGCTITPKIFPQQIETIDLSQQKQLVRDWYEQEFFRQKPIEKKPVLDIKNLSFSYYSQKPVLKNISLTLCEGQMVSLVGKNGAGKSTLAGVLCGFYEPDRGNISLNGEDIFLLSIKERGEKIGYVMQNPNQMISKPMIYDEVALGLRARKVSEDSIKERVYETLKICGLYPYRNWPISALSYGQKKRVTIASILVLNPQILILDEPTAGQDYRHYTEIMEFLKGLNAKLGITILMITHDMHLMLEYTERAIVLADGMIVADTSPAKLLTNEAMANQAYLKKTSLYDLAEKCGITDISGFVNSFIRYERKNKHGKGFDL